MVRTNDMCSEGPKGAYCPSYRIESDRSFRVMPLTCLIPDVYQDKSKPVLRIFEGFENEKYQRYDRYILQLTCDFNSRKEYYTGLLHKRSFVRFDAFPDLDPNLLKSLLIQESGGSEAWYSDPAQVNREGDFNKLKAKLGLEKGEKMAPEKSIWAGLAWLVYKASVTDCENNRCETTFVGWRVAVQNYNANRELKDGSVRHYERYEQQIFERIAKKKHVPVETRPLKKQPCLPSIASRK